MAKKLFWVGILAMVLVFGMTVVGCPPTDDNDNGGSGNGSGGGYSWSTWYTAQGTDQGNSIHQVKFSNSVTGSVQLEVQVENGSVIGTSSRNFSYNDSGFTIPSNKKEEIWYNSRNSGAIRYRYRQNGYGVQASSINGPSVIFQYLGDFAAVK